MNRLADGEKQRPTDVKARYCFHIPTLWTEQDSAKKDGQETASLQDLGITFNASRLNTAFVEKTRKYNECRLELREGRAEGKLHANLVTNLRRECLLGIGHPNINSQKSCEHSCDILTTSNPPLSLRVSTTIRKYMG